MSETKTLIDSKRESISDNEIILILGRPINSVRSSLIYKHTLNLSEGPVSQLPKSRPSLFHCDSIKSIQEEYQESLNLKKHEKYTISQNSNLLLIFNIIKGVTLLISVSTTLYFLAFSRSSPGYYLDISIWLFFLLDFFLQFFIEKRDEKARKIQNIYLLFKGYLKSWMILDILCLIPFAWLSNPKVEYGFRLLRILKLGFLSKSINIEHISKIFAKAISAGKPDKRNKYVMMIRHVWDYVNQVALLLFITYFAVCIWVYFCKFIKKYFSPGVSFINYYGIEDVSEITAMMKSWNFIYSSMSTTGYGDYSAVNKYEMSFFVLILIVGPCWFSYTASKAYRIMNTLLKEVKNSQNKEKLAEWMSEIESHKKIPPGLKSKINGFFNFYWKNDRLGDMWNGFQETDDLIEIIDIKHDYLKNLPEAVKVEIFSFLFDDLFKKFSYFFGCSSESMYRFAVYFQPRVYLAREKLIKFNKNVQELIFVTSGTFQIKTEINHEKVVVSTEKRHWIIGDYFIVENLKSFFEYSAMTVVHGFIIPAYVFRVLFKASDQRFFNYFQKVSQHIKELLKTVCDDFELFRYRYSVNNKSSKVLYAYENLYSSDLDLETIGNRMKLFRKNYIKGLKEKLVELSVKRMIDNKLIFC